MFIYFIKSIFKSLWANKKFTLINVIGFAFAISVCLAIGLFIGKEYSYDSHHKNVKRIVRIIDPLRNSSDIDYRAKDLLLENFPEFENACLVQLVRKPFHFDVENESLYINNIMSVDNDFFQLFTFTFLQGNPQKAFDDINSAVVTESIAKKLFGSQNPIGKEFLFGKKIPLTVSAVIKDFPETSSITANILVNAENNAFKFSFSCDDYEDKSSHRYEFRIYALLNKETNRSNLISKINQNSEKLEPYIQEVDFLSLSDIYLKDNTIGSNTKKGNLKLLKLLFLIAIIILILAIVNYVNLSLAQQNKRNLLIGIKKSYGASRSSLIFHFVIESILISLFAFSISVVLVKILTPLYISIFQTSINISSLLSPLALLLLFIGITVVGILSGIFPALILSNTNPMDGLRKSEKKFRRKFSSVNLLILFQFVVSIVLIVCVLIIQKQIHFVKNQDPGFSEEQLVRIDIPYLPAEEKSKVFSLRDELKQSAYFTNTTLSNGVPGKINFTMGSAIDNSEKNITVPCLIVDSSFLQTFDLEIVKGRKPEASDFDKVCIVNESFYNHFGFINLENKKFNNYRKGGMEIIAVVKDFQYNSLHQKIGPMCIITSSNNGYNQLSVKIAPNSLIPALKALEETWKEIMTDYPLQFQFFDEWFDAMYRKEERFAKTIALFAVLAIIISCFGILGLVMFSAEQRTKEIGVRKVNGAKTLEVITMLNVDFLKWVLLAFCIACPIAWYIMNEWLQKFAYKTELNWWVFASAGIIALGIALLTVSWQSWRAAKRNPVESLRYE